MFCCVLTKARSAKTAGPMHGAATTPTKSPEIKWRKSSYHWSSSGTCYNGDHITITAGKERKDQKLTLLHELAHWALPNNEHHGNNFWKLAFELYKWQGLSMRQCVNRETTCRGGRSHNRLNKIAKSIKESYTAIKACSTCRSIPVR